MLFGGCVSCGAGDGARGGGTGPGAGAGTGTGTGAWLLCVGRRGMTGEDAREDGEGFPALVKFIPCWNRCCRCAVDGNGDGDGDGALLGCEGCPAAGSSRGDSLPDRTLASSFFSSLPLLKKLKDIRLEGDGLARGAGDRPRRW